MFRCPVGSCSHLLRPELAGEDPCLLREVGCWGGILNAPLFFFKGLRVGCLGGSVC